MKPFWFYGINPVSEALRSSRCRIKEVWVAKGRDLARLEGIIGMAESKGVPIKQVERSKLDSLTANAPHQGVVGFIDQFNYADLDEPLQQGEGTPFLAVLDGKETNEGGLQPGSPSISSIFPSRRSDGGIAPMSTSGGKS